MCPAGEDGSGLGPPPPLLIYNGYVYLTSFYIARSALIHGSRCRAARAQVACAAQPLAAAVSESAVAARPRCERGLVVGLWPARQ